MGPKNPKPKKVFAIDNEKQNSELKNVIKFFFN